MNISVNFLKEIFQKNKNKIFVTCSITGKELTYNDLEILSLKLANLLSKKGIKKGDKISIILPNCIEYIIIYFACMQIGAIAVPINHKLSVQEVKKILLQVNSNFLFISLTFKDSFAETNSLVDQIFYFVPSCDLKDNLNKFFFNDAILEEKKYSKNSFNDIKDSDTLAIVFTSGTTSMPKGIAISYKNIISNALAFIKEVELTSDLKFFNILDLAYLGGFYNLTLIPLLAQGSIVLSKTFDPQVAICFWEQAIKYKINSLWLVPSIISILLHIDRSDLAGAYCKDNIKKVLVGTAPLPQKLKETFEKKYSVKLYENYGLSETFFISTNSCKQSEFAGVGKIIPGCEAFIFDENKNILEANQCGEIAIKSIYKNKYFGNETLEAELFFTGDIGYLDSDGHLFITDRKKDLIIRGGINISPKEIEEVILNYSNVKEVAVIGLTDDYMGEKIVAVINSDDNISELDIKKYCKNFLAAFKIPTEVVFMKNFPKSVTGKIQKNFLKESLLREQR
ncbi:acyl--CoA ligase [Candidatus Babeliales bacterium]|nr:acyl--CoA ligase [Candidatus Babeliales bacterium]